MPRTIPIALQQKLNTGITTMCFLYRFIPTQPGFPDYGVALLDREVVYDDGDGPLTYSPVVAMQPSTLLSSADLSVDGGEGYALVPEFNTPISDEDLASGAYDFCEMLVYQVDYNDLSAGHILIMRGTTGQVRVTDGGMAFTQELRGLAQALMQSITEKWSVGCRATFGSQPIGTGGGVIEERFPCRYDAEALWEGGTVATVGAEATQSFTTSGLSPAFGGNPGKVRWLTGRNAGRENEVDQFDDDSSGQVIGLTFPTMFPIQLGDTFEFRDDCPHTPAACKARGNWQWYRGEPNIPVGDDGQISVPGASAGLGTGGRILPSWAQEE